MKKENKTGKFEWKKALQPSVFKIILSFIPILMFMINTTGGLSDRYSIFAILSILIFSISIWITSNLFAGTIKPIYIDIVWVLILSIGIYIFISFLQKENKIWKKIFTTITIFAIYLVLTLISLALSSPKCPDKYHSTPEFSFNKSINNGSDALMTFKQYIGSGTITTSDIEYKNIEFTSDDTILVWVLKTKRIAIDKDGRIYKHIICF